MDAYELWEQPRGENRWEVRRLGQLIAAHYFEETARRHAAILNRAFGYVSDVTCPCPCRDTTPPVSPCPNCATQVAS